MPRQDEKLADLYVVHSGEATRLAYLLTRDRQVAQDIAQEAFVRLGAKLFVLRSPERVAGYLFRTVANLARDHGRRLARDRKLRARLPSSQSPPPDPEIRDEVLSALMAIAPRHRLVLFLRYYLDMSEEQAGQALGCSTSAVKSLTNRATVSVRKHLKEEKL